jgi:hypothetical protein
MFEISKFISARFLFRRKTLASAFGVLLLLAHTAQAQLPPPTAQDTASEAVCAAWDDSDNGGFGMGPWTLNPALNTPQNGFFVGNSTGNNGTSGDTNNDGDINTVPGPRAWGLYANSGQTASAVRDFNLPFTLGSAFEIFMDNGDVQAGGKVGFALQNSSGQDLLEVYFVGGGTQYIVHGNTPISSGVSFTPEGVRVVITLTTALTYQATLTPLVGGPGNTVSGNLRNDPGPISRLRLFNINAGASPSNDVFFNRITYYRGRVLNTDTGRGYLDIQPAIDDPATLAGHTISVSAGLYTGTQNNNIVINKPQLTLIGAGPTATVISHTASGTLKGIEIASGITGTTISSLRVQGFNDGGICAMQGNHFTTITNTHVYSNTAGGNCLGGIYLNGIGGINHATISHNEAVNNTSRGIVIWNGFKTNITITHNLARNNNCCGIELQDGTASGVLIAHNVVRDNFDNGIGTVGLTAGAGPNLIYSNTLINNGRFGIEIKLPSGSGLPSGDGSIVVLSNTVALTDTIANIKPVEQRDLAGIAAFRRAWTAGNADIPAGVIIQGNVVSGYQQPSASDGFGIVVEGARMTVISNTLENNDVGVQVQAGHTPYAPFTNTDGDQSNLADQYFGRGNSPVACAFYQAGNVFTGNLTNTRQAGTVTSGTVTNLNTFQTFCGIQQAISAPPTLNGHTISVTAGIYTELVSVTKQLTLLGAQHGQDAVARTAAFTGGKADSTVESIIYTPINNPTGGNPSAADLFRVLTHNVTIDGFVFDGNNPALLTSTVQIEGVDAHARHGVTNIGPNSESSYNPLNNLILRNNVFQNFARHGAWLENNGPVSNGNLIERNVLRRIRDRAIFLITNAYADIVSNTIEVPVSVSVIGFGINMLNFYANGSMAWLSNTITIVTNAMGMHANLFYAPSATLFIRGNVVNADAASAVSSLAVWGWGINVWSVQQGSTVIVEGNRVGLSGGRLGRGINVWNVPTNNTVRVISNAVANSTVGVHLDNINPYGGGGGASSTLLVTSNAITGTTDGIGLLVRVASPNVTGHGLMLISDTTVVSAGVGLRVETGITSTFMASATLHNSTLRNNGIGIQVLRGALTATHNYLLTNTLGVTNTGGAAVDVWLNRNAIVGNGAGITNTAAGTLNAECNWYGSANGPAGSGSGDSVSTGVDFNPWLLSDDLNGPCSSGSLTVQKVLVGPITPTTAWQFTATVPTGTLVFTLPAGGGAVTFGGLDLGPAIITETTKLGYVATSSCTTGATGGASIAFSLLGDVTCIFTNTLAVPTTITLSADPSSAVVNSSVLLTATVSDQFGNPVTDGTVVSFTSSLGSVSPFSATTVNGVATATLSATVAGMATVNSLSATAQVTFTPGAPFTLTLTAVPSTLLVGNLSTLTATVTDQYGNAVANGTTITFTTSLGTLSSRTAATSAGNASVTLSSTIPGVATVTATVGSLSATAQVTFTPGAPYTFTFTLTPTVIVANGISQSVGTVTVVDQYGNPVCGVAVNFLAGIGSFAPASGATNAGGQVTATLTSLTPAIENVFAVISGLGFRSVQVIYVNPRRAAPR